MERTIRQLLDFGRGNALNLRRVSAAYPLQNALETLGQQAPIHLACRVEPQAASRAVAVDLVRFEQALGNLLRNGLQAARHRVLLRCRVDGDHLCYSVEDDGPGVDSDLTAHLFEPFFTTKPTGSGTGMGLAVAHAAVRDHGGTIEVGRSELGGALFRIRLPCEKSPADGQPVVDEKA